MNNMKTKMQEAWNKRLQSCIREKQLSQQGLADALNRKYDTHTFQQQNISFWTRVGETREVGNKKQLIGFPKVETMIRLSEFFEKDIGYLLGETDDESFSLKSASEYIGLKQETVKTIKRYTNWKTGLFTVHLDDSQVRYVLDLLLTSHSFRAILRPIYDLIKVNRAPGDLKQRWADAEEKYGMELFMDALEHHDDYVEGDSAPSPEYAEAVRTINGLIDDGAADDDQREFASNECRYRLNRLFESMIDEILKEDIKRQEGITDSDEVDAGYTIP